MKIEEKTFKAMPAELQALFHKCSNPGSDEVVGLFPVTKSGRLGVGHGAGNSFGVGNCDKKPRAIESEYGGDSGSAARFFKCCPPDDAGDAQASRLVYIPKASKKDRDEGCEGMPVKQSTGGGGMNDPNGDDVCGKYGSVKSPSRNHHPCVKPTALMRYLCKLVTPPNGIILDPFMGSGSTGKGAVLEGFSFIGIEQDADYFEIAKARINTPENPLWEVTMQ